LRVLRLVLECLGFSLRRDLHRFNVAYVVRHGRFYTFNVSLLGGWQYEKRGNRISRQKAASEAVPCFVGVS